jgi:pimeloyl-ACP methyl ester carboxylesterase
MATAEINGIPIRYEDSGGAGPALLFSHGFLMDHTMFDAQVAALADDYRCIRWDERGFGDTPAPGPFTYWDSAPDAVGVLDACGVDQAVWIGMSQGGFLLLRGALASPERVGALVLIDSQAAGDPPEVSEGYRAMFAGLSSDDDAVYGGTIDAVKGMILGDPRLEAEWVPRWAARRTIDITHPAAAPTDRDDVHGRLGEITCPTLVIHGTADQAIPLEVAHAVAAALPDCRGVVEADGAAHAPNMTHPDLVNPALTSFLAGL